MITSTSNQQIKNIMQLQKKSKTRCCQRVFVVEGPKMAFEAPREWVDKIYVSQHFFADDIHRAQLLGYDFEVVSDAVMKSVSDTKTPQGILCLIKMPRYTLEELCNGANPVLLVLNSIQDPGNLGTMIRTGEGAGISGILMDKTTVDIFNPKVIRSTMGSLYRVPFLIAEDLSQTVSELKQRGITFYAAHLKGVQSYEEPDYTGGCGFLVGNEGNGLSDEIAGLADAYIRIPMAGKVESLNAAMAAGILMYEAARKRRRNIPIGKREVD